MSIVAPTAKASDIQMDYMNLLVTELKNQNPLEPLDNKEMASQLAQFSQLQQLEAMNSRFAGVLTAVERAYANSLLGKEVSFLTITDAGDSAVETGSVNEVCNGPDGSIFLAVGDRLVGLEYIVSVKN
jgi:flagellar basal-body rod modification protein FlgD